MAENTKVAVPYLPWKTFVSVLESLAKFLPDQVHTSMWPTYAGGVKSQIIATLSFLKLIEANGTPTPLLKKIVGADKTTWPSLIKEALAGSYTSLMACDLTKATPGSFDAEMRKFGQEGDTHRKAASFFLQAAKFANVPLSPLLTQKGGLSATRTKRRSSTSKKSPAKPNANDYVDEIDESVRMTATGVKKVVLLDNEATLSLVLDKNFGELPSIQRKFVNKLIDMMEEFVDSSLSEFESDETS